MDRGRVERFTSLPKPLALLDQLSEPGSQLRRQLCIAASELSQLIARDQQRALTQVWLPGFTVDGLIALSCQGAPYAIAGEGDLCALFRCASCRHVFYPTSPDPCTRGAIGRVFSSHKPECCTNVASAPQDWFHRADAARRCLLHSLCVLPLWLPAVSKQAPVAVLEVLQPDTQPDFDILHSLAAHALKEVTLTKATVVAPALDLFETFRVANGHGSSPVDLSPGILNRSRSTSGSGAAKRTFEGLFVQDNDIDQRVQIVFNDRQMAESSGDHLTRVATQSRSTSGSGAAQRTFERLYAQENNIDQRVQIVFHDRQMARSSGDHLTGVATQCGSSICMRLAEQPPVDMDINSRDLLRRCMDAHFAETGQSSSDAKEKENGPNESGGSGGNQGRAESIADAQSDAEGHKAPNTASAEKGMATEQEGGAGGSPEGVSGPQGRGGVPRPGSGEIETSMAAMELLDDVQRDMNWQEASRVGGSLRGNSAALLTVLHSQSAATAMAAPQRVTGQPPVALDAAGLQRAADAAVPGRKALWGGGGMVRATIAPPSSTLREKILRAEGFHSAPRMPPPAARLAVPRPPNDPLLAHPIHNPHHTAPHLHACMSFEEPLGQLPLSATPRGMMMSTLPLGGEDAKADRSRANRVDGGIGRRLTLETLSTQFGKGLRDAAEELGMCPTTLKRACRRLGVKRWPRTPEAAEAVLREATEAATASGAAPAPEDAAGAAADLSIPVALPALSGDGHKGLLSGSVGLPPNLHDVMDLLDGDEPCE